MSLHETRGERLYEAKEPLPYECINHKIGQINNQGGIKPVFVLTFDHNGQEAIKYFTCTLSKAGNYSVTPNGDFAKLYRLTLGKNPKPRYSKAQQLLSHFLGYKFYCITETVRDKNGKPYQKVKEIMRPENPIMGDAWTATGTLKKQRPKPRKPNQAVSGKNDKKLATNWQRSGNELEKVWQQVSNDKTLEASETLGIEPVLDTINPYNIHHRPIDTYIHVDTRHPKALKDTITISNLTETPKTAKKDNSLIDQDSFAKKPKTNVITWRPFPNESKDDFYDRIIEATYI